MGTYKFLDQAIEKVGYTGDRDFLVNAFQEVFELNEEMVDLIKEESKRGTPLHLLSNTNDIHVPYLFETFPVFHLFDNAVYSHEVFCMKPSPEIYHKTITNLEAYMALFDGVSSEKAIGEASPAYLVEPKAPERIQRYIPKTKMIAMLRNPAERAHSHFLHLIKYNYEPCHDFGLALQKKVVSLFS